MDASLILFSFLWNILACPKVEKAWALLQKRISEAPSGP